MLDFPAGNSTEASPSFPIIEVFVCFDLNVVSHIVTELNEYEWMSEWKQWYLSILTFNFHNTLNAALPYPAAKEGYIYMFKCQQVPI